MNDLNKNNGTPEKGEYIGRYEKTADNDAVSSRPLKPLRPLKKARSSQNNISNVANVPPVRAQNAPEHPKIHNKKSKRCVKHS